MPKILLPLLLTRPIDWDRVLAKSYPPPIVPKLSGPDDTACFADEFTGLSVHDSPSPEFSLDAGGGGAGADGAAAAGGRGGGGGENPFRGFSYVHGQGMS